MPTEIRRQILHPEALFDSPYEAHDLDVSAYVAPGPWRLAGQDACGFTLAAGPARLRVEAVGDGGVRLRLHPEGEPRPSATEDLGLLTYAPPAGPVCVTVDAATATLRAGGLVTRVDLASGAVTVGDEAGAVLVETLGGVRVAPQPGEHSGHRFLCDLRRQPGERFFGCGGRSALPDRTGSTFDAYAEKVGKHDGDYGGFPIPWFLSSRGHGVLLDNPWPHVYADLAASDPSRWWLHTPGGAWDLTVLRGPEWPDAVRRLTDLTGRPPFPQRWWLGFWVSALGFGTAAEVEATVARLRADAVPLDAVVVDGPWRGGPEFLKKYMSEGEYPTNDINWHPDFGDGPGMLARLAGQGVRTVLHQNSRSYLTATAERGDREGTLRRVGREVVPHLATDAGRAFYRDQVTPRCREGVALWWLDHGDRVSGEVAPGLPSRNLFGALWAQATTRIAAEAGGGEQVVLIRGSGLGSQRHALPWPGDTRYGLTHAEQDLWFCHSAGLSGFGLTSFDLGGFFRAGCTEPHEAAFDEENLCRRLAQALLYVPNARVHGDDSAPPKLPHHCGPAARSLYRRMLAWRYRLLPWFHHWAAVAHRSGAPVLRHLGWSFRNDNRALSCHDQCLVGDGLLVAPVFARGAASRRVYLPAGPWHDFWTGHLHSGPGDVVMPAPLHEPEGLPVFVRAGSALAMQDEGGGAGDAPPDQLQWDLYPSAEGGFDLIEAPTLVSTIRWRDRGDRVEVEIANVLDRPRSVSVRAHLGGPCAGILADGVPVPGHDRLDEAARGAVRQRLDLAPGQRVTMVFLRG